MELELRACLLDWVAQDGKLATLLGSVSEEVPVAASLPMLSVVASESRDWSTKTETGWEVRLTLALKARADKPDGCAALAAAVRERVMALPRQQSAFRVVSAVILKASTRQLAQGGRQVETDYRFRLLAQ